MRFVYVGNVLGHRLANTYCPACGASVIERWGLGVTSYRLDAGRCPRCSRQLPGMWAG